MARRRGGYQAASNGGAVSPPGSMSQRKVPHLERTGLPYRENKAVNEQQAAAPLNPDGRPGAAGGGPRPAGPTAQPPDGVFAPSERPEEPPTAGVDFGPGPGSTYVPRFDDDVNYLVRAIAAERPDLADYLLNLIDV